MSHREQEQARHEYLLQEIRLTGEDIKSEITDKLDKKMERMERRVTRLERWQLSIASAAGGIIAWWKYGHFISKGN